MDNNQMLNIKKMITVTLIGILIIAVAPTLFIHNNRADAKGSAIFNNIKDCQLSLSANPPPTHSAAGVPVPVAKENLVTVCGYLLGVSGVLTDLTESFADCVKALSGNSEHSQQTISFVCSNLNPTQ